jgi:hypothetical protein
MACRHTIRQSNYDSIFKAAAGRPAKLTIRLKVALFPPDPSAAAGPPGAPLPVHLADSVAHFDHGQVRGASTRLVW